MSDEIEYRSVMFSGASDDLVQVEGEIPGCDEYPARNGSHDVAARFLVYVDRAEECPTCGQEYNPIREGVEVTVFYGQNGTWSASMGLMKEGESLPDWKHEIVRVHEYSTGLVLTVPKNAQVMRIDRD